MAVLPKLKSKVRVLKSKSRGLGLGMNSSQSCSSCSKATSKGFSQSSHGVVSRGVGITPICHCGDIAVMKVARTSRNKGRKFWGCRHYKGGISSGRPKKKRRMEPWELTKDGTKMSVGGQRKRCSICRELGHNKKMCLLNPAIIQPTQSTQAQSSQPIAPSQPSSPQSPQPPQPSQDSIRDLSEPIQRQKLNIRRKDP